MTAKPPKARRTRPRSRTTASSRPRRTPSKRRTPARKREEATADAGGPEDVEKWASEQAAEQWLRRVPQDPGGLLRRKFLYQYQRLGVDQDGNRVIEGAAAEQRPW